MVNEKILVAEDDVITAMGIKNNLELWGYQVPSVVSSGEDAVKEAFRIQPALIIMDINLKGDMNGAEAAERIRSLNIPLIYLTGLMDQEIQERVEKSEHDVLLVKPFDQEDLRDKIESVLSRDL